MDGGGFGVHCEDDDHVDGMSWLMSVNKNCGEVGEEEETRIVKT